MFHSYLSVSHQILLSVSILLLIGSLVLFFLQKYKWALLVLILAAIPLKYFFISLDGFLNTWDESFHALVAKNMARFPLKPMLYQNPVLDYDYMSWISSHIWLHKQPLFLWQSALCIKLFGANEIAFRLPTLILSILFIPVLYRMGCLLVSKTTGYIAALFFVLSFFINNLTSGRYPLAENDVIFMIYIGASCWAYLEYVRTQKGYWLIWIGLFSGFAVLTKWLVGVLVYSAWGISIVLKVKQARKEYLKSFIPLLKSLGITLLLFIPWTLYTLIRFPKEAKYEMSLNARHFTEAIENHTGNFDFHFLMMNKIYNPFNFYLIFLFIIIGIFLIKNRNLRIAIFCWIMLPILFYSVAETKMESFTVIAFPFVVLMIGAVFEMLYFQLKEKIGRGLVFIIAIFTFVLLGYHVFNIEQVQFEHTNQSKGNHYLVERIFNKPEYFRIQSEIKEPIENAVLFNVPFPYNIDMMFYTDLTVYPYPPTPEITNNLVRRGYKLYALNKNLPPEILSNKNIIKLHSNLKADIIW